MKKASGVRLDRMGPHATLWFEKPEKGPPVVTLDVMSAMEAAVKRLAGDANLRTLTIRSEGGSVFLAGGDLQEFQSLDARRGRQMAVKMRRILAALDALPVPVIAALTGDAYGGGCEVAVAADVRIAVPSAHLSFSQGRFGVCTGWGGATRLVQLVGPGRAMLMLATGRPIPALEARRMGLVEEVVGEDESLEDRLAAMRATMEMIGPGAMGAIKKAIRGASVLPAAQAMEQELELFAAQWASPEHREGLEAFFEHRAPAWATHGWGEPAARSSSRSDEGEDAAVD